MSGGFGMAAMAAGTAVSAGAGYASDASASQASQQAYQDQVAALKVQGQEDTAIYQQKQESTYDMLTKTLDSQTAAAAASGMSASSPTISALKTTTINTGGRKFQQLYLQNELTQTNLKEQAANAEEDNAANQAKISGQEASQTGGLLSDIGKIAISSAPLFL